MKMTSDGKAVAAGLSAMLSRLGEHQPCDKPASGIEAVELTAEELERVSGGLLSARMAMAGTTCCPCCDDCGQ